MEHEFSVESRWLLVGFWLTAIIVLSPIFFVGLLCDDYQYWLRGVETASPLEVLNIQGGRARPISTYLLMLGTSAAEGSVWILGLLRIVHHGTNAFLVSIFAAHIFPSQKHSAIAGFAFLVWSSHAEVYWQSSLHDVLAASFFLLTLIVASKEELGTTGRLASVFLLSLLAYWSKESTWCLAPILMLVGCVRPKKGILPVVASTLAFALYLPLRFAMTRAFWADVIPENLAASSVSFEGLAKNLAAELYRLLVPGWVKSGGASGTLVAILILGLGAAFVIAIASFYSQELRRFLFRRDRLTIVVIAACILVALVPISKLSVSLENTENSRYLYLPTIFFALLISGLTQQLRTRPRAIIGLSFLIIFQAVSLHVIGWNWVAATKDMTQYRHALADLISSQPSKRHFVVACVPDNYRGAFSARNTTYNLVRAAKPRWSRTSTILSTRYSRGKAAGCDYSFDGKTLVITDKAGRFSQTNPAFYGASQPAKAGIFEIQPDALRGYRASSLTVGWSTEPSESISIAVYDGKRLQPVLMTNN
ncbi:MAG: hypothetical protein AAF662_07370 [Pseudomonadota bacterium]